MVKVYPKCLNKKELAYTATGYLLPCCWLDVPTGWSEPQIKRLMQKHLLLEKPIALNHEHAKALQKKALQKKIQP